MIYLRLLLLLPCLVGMVRARHQLRHSTTRHLAQEEEVLDCTYVRGDMHYDDGGLGDFDACMDGETLYDIPSEFIAGGVHDQLHSGTSVLSIVGAHKHRTTDASTADEIEATSADTTPQVSIVESTVAPASLARSNTIDVATMGQKTIIVVRVTSLDSNVSLTVDELSESTFGTDTVSLAIQTDRCSNGALTYVPAIGDHIHNGVGELQLDEKTTGVPTKNFQTPLRHLFVDKFGSEDQYDFILYCMPKGTGDRGWIAYAFHDTPFSYYHDDWCGSLTSRMHELGHNVGMGHSGKGSAEGADAYDDKSCAMGFSSKGTDSPQECFNGWRHWFLGWYDARKLAVDPNLVESWGGTLAAFVDYTDMIDPTDYAIVNVGDVYLQYNLKDKHNWQVVEAGDQITIVQSGEQGESEAASKLLGTIDLESPLFERDGIVIQVCEQGTKAGKVGNVRFFKISVHKQGASSTCDIAQAAQTSPPTPEPPRPPTPTPITPMPTPYPTPEPTPMPATPASTANPTRQPTQNEAPCADSTVPFQINGLDVYCDNLANDDMLRDLYCRPCEIAYLECRQTCNSCDVDATTSAGCNSLTSPSTSTTVLRPWDGMR